jgi:hypothetical protein
MGWIFALIGLIIGFSIGMFIDVEAYMGLVKHFGESEKKADEGLVFCKVGDNYCWLTPADYAFICLRDHSE